MDSATRHHLVQSIKDYLDCKQRADWLWQQIDMHLHTSYIAEELGDTSLVPKHLQSVALLLWEANQAQRQVAQQLALSVP